MARKAVRSVDRRPKTAIVLGGARCVWEDLSEAQKLFSPDGVVCVNDIGVDYPERVDFWCTLHPEKFEHWQSLRARKARNMDFIAYAHEPRDGVRIDKITDYRYPGMTSSGSSGLLAVKVAQEEGFERIVLCGVPMSFQGHYFEGASVSWDDKDSFAPAWEIALPRLGNVRSMSGWTRELLGAPTSQWLGEPSL